MTPQRVIDRLLSNVETVEGGCIVSLYSTGSHGYSQIGWQENGRRTVALGHRVAWEAAHGPITDSLTVDHMCRNKRCVNVEHLRLLPLSVHAPEHQLRKTHCPQGHPYSGDNLSIYNGWRYCKACRKDRDRRRQTAA